MAERTGSAEERALRELKGRMHRVLRQLFLLKIYNI